MEENVIVMNDSDKDFLIDHYAQLEFVDDVSNFRCGRCDRVAIVHYYSSCDHLFCKNCKNLLNMETDNSWMCPKCDRAVNPIGRKKFDVEKKISNLRVQCLNRKYGCQQTVELSKLLSHYKTCPSSKLNDVAMGMTGSNVMEGILLRLDKITDRLDSMTEFLNHSQNDLEAKLANRLELMNKSRDLQTEMKMDELKQCFRDIFGVEMENIKRDVDKKPFGTFSLSTTAANVDRTSFEETITSQLTENYISHSFEKINNVLPNLERDFQLEMNGQEKSAQMFVEEIKQLFIKILHNQLEVGTFVESSIKSMFAEIDGVKRDMLPIKNEPTSYDTKSKKNIEKRRHRMSIYRSKEQFNTSREITDGPITGQIALQSVLKEIKTSRTSIPDSQLMDESYKWEVVGLKEKIEHEKFTAYSPVFSINANSFNCQAKLEHNRSGIYLFVCFKDVLNSNKPMELKALPSVTYTLCDLQTSSSTEKKNRVRVKEYLFDEKILDAYDRYYYEELLGYKSNLTSRYLQKNKALISVSVSAPNYQSSLSTNGVLVWKIDHYQKKRQMVKDELIVSVQGPGFFYTDEKGYRVKAELSWDSVGQMYVRISFLTGEFDSALPKSFQHKTTVTIFDQLAHQHYSFSVMKDIKLSKWYNISLLTSSDVLQGNYLKDGSLLLKIAIEAKK